MNNDLISLFDIPKIKVSVDTFWFFKHCMKDNYFNAHIMIRMLAIDCYYGKNDYGWDWYNKMQLTRVADNPLIPKRMARHEKEFKKLIKSFEENEFIEEYPLVVNKEMLFIDGAHRLALALYFGIERVTITVDKDYYFIDSRDFSFDWFEKKQMGYMKTEALRKYNEICEFYGGKQNEL